MQRSAAVFDDSVYLKDGVSLNWNGTLQESPYDNNEKQINADNKEKLTNIEFDNTITKITSNLDLRESTLLLTDETIAINKVTNLTSTLTGIQDRPLFFRKSEKIWGKYVISSYLMLNHPI